MNTRRITRIARWEYTQKVRSKAFIIGLFLTPLLMIGFGVVPSLLIQKSPDKTFSVGVVDRSRSYFQVLKARIEQKDTLKNGQPAYLLADYTGTGPDEAAWIQRADSDALNERIEGVIVIHDSGGRTVTDYRSPNPSNFRLVETFSNAIEQIGLERRLLMAGIDTGMYNRTIRRDDTVRTVKLTTKGASDSDGFSTAFFGAYIGIMLLMFLTLTTGQSLVRSLVEEKSNRIMELLTSSATPQELMWGKLLGLSGLGITQIGVWIAMGMCVIVYFGSGIPSSVAEIFRLAPLILVYLLLGYLFYAALFIGLGSLATTEQEAQMMTSYISIFLAMPTVFAFAVMQDPNAGFVRILSYIPVLTPSLMMTRIVVKMPSVYEILGTILLMVVSTVVLIRIAGKVFRTAILLYGKRPSFREVLAWFRKA